jgi:hypothetical protein
MPQVLKELFASKKFWSAVVGILAVLIGKIGWNVSEEVLWQIVTIIGTLLGAQGLADIGKERAKTETEALAERLNGGS